MNLFNIATKMNSLEKHLLPIPLATGIFGELGLGEKLLTKKSHRGNHIASYTLYNICFIIVKNTALFH